MRLREVLMGSGRNKHTPETGGGRATVRANGPLDASYGFRQPCAGSLSGRLGPRRARQHPGVRRAGTCGALDAVRIRSTKERRPWRARQALSCATDGGLRMVPGTRASSRSEIKKVTKPRRQVSWFRRGLSRIGMRGQRNKFLRCSGGAVLQRFESRIVWACSAVGPIGGCFGLGYPGPGRTRQAPGAS